MPHLSSLKPHQTSQPGLATLPPPTEKHFYLVGEAGRLANRPKRFTAGRTSVAINGRWHALRGRTATFEQLLQLAFPERQLTTPRAATITFRHGVAAWSTGSLTPGDVIELTDGLLVNASATNAS